MLKRRQQVQNCRLRPGIEMAELPSELLEEYEFVYNEESYIHKNFAKFGLSNFSFQEQNA